MKSQLPKVSSYYLHQLGIERWTKREQRHIDPLTSLAQEVSTCTACLLHKSRTQTVFARGNPKAKLMIIGEAPGFYEDQKGEPFVGKAGGLLDKMLSSIGYCANDIYVANVIKCRPPNNRDPEKEEIEACSGFLAKQIEAVNPHCILAVGRFAGQFLINQNLPMNKMRNQIHIYKEKPVLVTFHPAYLLRNPLDKRLAFQDLLSLKSLISI